MSIKSYFVTKMLNRWEENDRKKLINATFPTGVIEECDISYTAHEDRERLLDVYYTGDKRNHPLAFIDIHGGGFMAGNKKLNRLFGHHMAKRGALVFNIDYCLAKDGITVYDQIRDIAMACEWVFQHLDAYGGSNASVYLCGHSSGAVLATVEAMVSCSDRLKDVYGISQNHNRAFQGLVLDCGLMTFYQKNISYWGMRSMVFEKGYKKSSRYKNMIWGDTPESSSLPRTFLISNQKDELNQMTIDFKKILDEKKVANQLDFTGNDGHMGIIYNPDSNENRIILTELIAWMKK